MSSRPQNSLSRLANQLLTLEELGVAARLEHLIGRDKKRQTLALLGAMFPKYWRDDVGLRTYWPDSVYRTIYYLTAFSDYVDHTRGQIQYMGQHLEGLLGLLASRRVQRPIKPLGRQVRELLKRGVLPVDLAEALFDFNEALNNPGKHSSDDPLLPSRMDQRRFSTHDTLLALLIMRRVSTRLFDVLEANGVHLPEGWPSFDRAWLTWNRVSPFPPMVIAQREHLPPPWALQTFAKYLKKFGARKGGPGPS